MLSIDWADAAEQLAGEDHIDQSEFNSSKAETDVKTTTGESL